jgi:hypothetical protein
MNLFIRNSPYYHLLKYSLFLLKHPVYLYDAWRFERDTVGNDTFRHQKVNAELNSPVIILKEVDTQ